MKVERSKEWWMKKARLEEPMSDEDFDKWMAELDESIKKISEETDAALKSIGYHPVYTVLDDLAKETEKLNNE